jgi:protein transport protein SEC24
MFFSSLSCSLITFIYPRLMALHTIGDDIGVKHGDAQVVLPPSMNLASDKIDRQGIYLLEDGETMLMWVSRGASPELVTALFGTCV